MKLIFGCGYLGERVAKKWRDGGERMAVVTRSADRARAFSSAGYYAIVANVSQSDSLADLPAASTVLFAVGFDRSGNQSITDIYAGGLQNLLAALPSQAGRVIYISTTGIYGDAGGQWIDESTPPAPMRDGGRASLAAEQVLLAHPLGENAVILRLAGIYGPGRIPFLDLLRNGEPIPAAGAGHLNLIHVDDAASVVIAVSKLPPFEDGPRVYCVSDGQAVVRETYYREVARQIGAPVPTFVASDPASPRAARAEADRRVSNSKMLRELGVSLVYPDYRSGLKAILT